MILGIDPGTNDSGWVLFSQGKVLNSGVTPNEEMKSIIRQSTADLMAVEMIASYGMAVGKETFETCVWIGRFIENWDREWKYVYRKDVKMHLCGTVRAKDPNIRQALIDKLGPVGTKNNPGPLFGISSHKWSALAVAVTALNI